MAFVDARFVLNGDTQDTIRMMKPKFGFNGFGEFVFYRTYSQNKPDGSKENLADVVIRVMQGIMSIRKDWYIKTGIYWDESFWQNYAHYMAISLFNFEWCPPGRGLWMMGRDYIYENGSMALNNCGFTLIGDEMGKDYYWMMDALMCGVGIGFNPVRNDDQFFFDPHTAKDNCHHTIEDSREGWCESVKLLIESYTHNHVYYTFDYSKIRGPGKAIKGFGGISSGPDPLINLHTQIRLQFDHYNGDSVLLKTNIANLIGRAVVSGNVRRSAELACAPITDPTFADLKDYNKYPERMDFGWMSNNSLILSNTEDFDKLNEIADRVVVNGEPGLINNRNLKYGRLRRNLTQWDDTRPDKAIGFNPCGEQPLEDKEVCNVVETVPTSSTGTFTKSCEYATMYASTVSLLPTHSPDTNAVLNRNRRIGVSLMDVSGWIAEIGTTKVTRHLRQGYETVRKINNWLNDEAGIPRSIRVTTVKPGGTVPKIIGKTGGFSWPTFTYTLMRVTVAKNSSVCSILDAANVPKEQHLYEDNSWSYAFPVKQGPAAPATEISLWEQAALVVLLQREWSDNAVSNTLYFNPETESEHVERVLASIIGDVKSLSLLPHTEAGVIPQSPQTGITEQEYNERLSQLKPFDWSKIRADFESVPEAYCQGDKCQLPQPSSA